MHFEYRLRLGRRRRSGRLRILELRGSRHPDNQQSNEKKQSLCPNRLVVNGCPLDSVPQPRRESAAQKAARGASQEGGRECRARPLVRRYRLAALLANLVDELQSPRALHCSLSQSDRRDAACISRIPVSA